MFTLCTYNIWGSEENDSKLELEII
jgi:hypothetical protein